ncbi:MAG TPA: hypothetical protein VH306_13670 [Gaiellaceae bacterium]
MDPREERIGRNETLFREVNERIEQVSPSYETEFICECGDRDCIDPVPMTLGEYEKIRMEPHRFLVVPGHEIPDVERVVDRGDGYLVVEKHEGGPAELAEREDPRS